MLKNINWSHYHLKYAIPAALVYCIPLVFFLRDASYTDSWLLYLGNFLFLICVVLFLFSFNRTQDENTGTITLMRGGGITTISGMVIALLLSVVLLICFVTGLFGPGMADRVFQHAPSSMTKTHGMVVEVIANAILGNMAGGSFVSLLFPFSIKDDRAKKTPRPSHGK